MRLRVFTDYSLRVLVYLASHPDRFVTITEIAGAYGISANHLMKVVQHLAAIGAVVTLRGPHGGLRLARPASAIRVGDVLRQTEPELALPKCDQSEFSTVLERAMMAFMAVLDDCTVADLMVEARSKTQT